MEWRHDTDIETTLLEEIDRNHGIMPIALPNGRHVNTRRRNAARRLEAKGMIRIIRMNVGARRLFMARPDQADRWEGKLRAWERTGPRDPWPGCFPIPETTPTPPPTRTGDREPVTLAQAMAEALSGTARPRPARPSAPTTLHRTGPQWTPRPPISTDDALVGQNLTRLLSGHAERSIVRAMRERGFTWNTWTLRNTEQGSRQLRLVEALALAQCLLLDPGDCIAFLLDNAQGLGPERD